MGLFSKPDCVLLRLVLDEKAPIMARVRALEAIEHPPLIALRSLLVQPKTPRKKPVPSKLTAVAAFKYKQEYELRRTRKLHKAKIADNPFGI